VTQGYRPAGVTCLGSGPRARCLRALPECSSRPRTRLALSTHIGPGCLRGGAVGCARVSVSHRRSRFAWPMLRAREVVSPGGLLAQTRERPHVSSASAIARSGLRVYIMSYHIGGACGAIGHDQLACALRGGLTSACLRCCLLPSHPPNCHVLSSARGTTAYGERRPGRHRAARGA